MPVLGGWRRECSVEDEDKIPCNGLMDCLQNSKPAVLGYVLVTKMLIDKSIMHHMVIFSRC